MEPDIGTCSVFDGMTIDDFLLEGEEAPTLDEVLAASNPRQESIWALEWPAKIEYRRDRTTGEKRRFIRRPEGPFTDATSGGIPIRVKINVKIGMLTIDREWCTTCTRHCYEKGYREVRPSLKIAGKTDEIFWHEITGRWLNDILHSERFEAFARKVGKTPAFLRGRIRLATRGEAFSKPQDVLKVADLCRHNGDTKFWIPTRAWADDDMADLIEDEVMGYPNARVIASMDPSNTDDEEERIAERGWNTIFFGDDKATQGRFLCPKTWQKIDSYCRICDKGCFKAGEVHVHLKVHGTKIDRSELTEYRLRHGMQP